MPAEELAAIVGVGARTPLGLNALASSAAVRAGFGAVREHPYFVDKAGEPMYLTMDALLPADFEGGLRLASMARSALDEAVLPLAELRLKSRRIPLFLGLPEHRPGLAQDLESHLLIALRELQVAEPSGERFSLDPIRFVAAGHSAGLMALQQACEHLQSGASEFCLAGGVDSYLAAETLEWLDESRRLMSGENRSGFVPGEGAAVCLVALSSTAKRYGLKVLASAAAMGTAIEDKCITSDEISLGFGLTEAIKRAAAGLQAGEKVDFTYCDLNGERYRNEEFTYALLRTQAFFVDASDNLTPADCWGDMGAASGPLLAVLAVASGLRDYAKGARQLLWTSSESGHRTAVLLRIPISFESQSLEGEL